MSLYAHKCVAMCTAMCGYVHSNISLYAHQYVAICSYLLNKNEYI